MSACCLGRQSEVHVSRQPQQSFLDVCKAEPVGNGHLVARACLGERIDKIESIGDQAAGGDEGALKVDRGQLVPGRQRDDQIAMQRRGPAPCCDQTVIRGAREGRDGALDLARVAHIDRADLNAPPQTLPAAHDPAPPRNPSA